MAKLGNCDKFDKNLNASSSSEMSVWIAFIHFGSVPKLGNYDQCYHDFGVSSAFLRDVCTDFIDIWYHDHVYIWCLKHFAKMDAYSRDRLTRPPLNNSGGQLWLYKGMSM